MNHPEIAISKILIRKNKTIAVAESCTGGLLSNLLTNIPGSSQYFLLGIVAYSNQAKISLLKVPIMIIKRYGAVSNEVSQLMSQNVRKISSADYGIGITGIAGPTRGASKKPIGTVFISIATKNKVATKRFHCLGRRLEVKRKAVIKTLSILKRLLKKS